MTWTILDGQGMPSDRACIPANDPAVTLGWSVFETLQLPGADVDVHLDRLAASCEAGLIAMPDRAQLRAEVALAASHIPEGARIRITLTGGGRRIVSVEAIDPLRRHQPIRAVRGPHRTEPVLGGSVKHGSRLPWVVAVHHSGVDDVLMVDAEGHFTEGTMCGILAVVGGELFTAPADGRILASTTVAAIVRRAEALGIPVHRMGPSAKGPWDGLYVASATRDIAPVVELDGVALPVWDPIGRRLRGQPLRDFGT